MVTRNYQKHHHWNPIQRILILNFYRVLLKEAKKLNSESILDVGCGEGFTLDKLQKAKIGKELEGIDNFDKAI
ncbi:MAG: hypothetical protein M1450_01040, partial [Patescibacteria group bacterium]|nr:hypothetical protein [Patescibacteria group bacterium]